MSEYMFRGKRLDNKELIIGSLIVNSHMGEVKHLITANGMGQVYVNSHEVDQDTIARFWRNDHEDKPMFEGDIIEFHYFYGSVGAGLGFVEAEHDLKGILSLGELGWEIEAIEGEHWAGYTGFEDGEGKSTIMDLTAMNESGIHEESFKSTGKNIYQNPEFLKQCNTPPKQ